MRVVLTSDLHGNLPEIPKCDLLIVAGDVAPDYIRTYSRGTASRAQVEKGHLGQSSWLQDDFADWLNEVPAEKVIGIAGNHDFVFEKPSLIPDNLRWTYLRDSLTVVDGLRVWGTPWVPNLPFWAFYASDNALAERASGIPARLDFLVSHGPPLGYLDDVAAGSKRGNWKAEHVGDYWLTQNLERIDATYLVCGHIHEGYGKAEVPETGTQVFNVSHVDVNYAPINPVVVLDL